MSTFLVNVSQFRTGGRHIFSFHIHHITIYIYFRELTSKDPRSELGYRLTVQVDNHDPARPLSVNHVPSLGNKVSYYYVGIYRLLYPIFITGK